MNLYFIAPLHLCESGYNVSIVSYGEEWPINVLITGPLQSFLDPAVTYSFSNINIQSRLPSTSFGSVSSHYGNGDTFKSVIQLSDIIYEAYSNSKKIVPKQLSPTLIKLSCGIHNFELSYPHPINFKTPLKLSRSRRTITIKATRECYRYENETASVCLVNPNNALTFPQLQLNDLDLKFLIGMQFIDSEQILLLTNPLLCPPLPLLKDCINIMMKEKKDYFAFSDPSDSIFAMVVILKRVFDYQLKAPAIDLVYCVTTSKIIAQKWGRFSSCVETYKITHDAIQLMDKTFQYFSRRTICSSDHEAEGLLDVQRKVDSSFKRAVIYPLYGDADDTVRNQHKIWSPESYCCSFCGMLSVDLKKCNYCQIMQFCDECQEQHLMEHNTIFCERNKFDSKSEISPPSPNSSHPSSPPQTCGYCHKSSAHLKKCSRCYSMAYCSIECQVKHWEEHKALCCEQPIENTSKCSYCNTVSSQLKRCTVCLSVQYCNRECQQKHWKEHKALCCKQPKVTVENTSKCSYCNTVSGQLKRCTMCFSAQYCNRECQQKHWKEHKASCCKQPIVTVENTSKCSYCNTVSGQLKRCTMCFSAQYCNRECQQKHWKEHKASCCKQPKVTVENTSKCSYCNTVSSQLKRCTMCFSAQYCNRECQQKHWKEHKLHCKEHEGGLAKKPSDFEFKQDDDEIHDQKCSFCSRAAKDLKKCTRCLKVHYCDKTCQQKHWPNHKIMCQSKPS